MVKRKILAVPKRKKHTHVHNTNHPISFCDISVLIP